MFPAVPVLARGFVLSCLKGRNDFLTNFGQLHPLQGGNLAMVANVKEAFKSRHASMHLATA